MIDLNQLADSKASEKFSSKDWFEVINSLSAQRVFGEFTDGEILRIIKAASTPSALLHFLEHIHRVTMETKEQAFDHLSEEMDKYHFELTFWMDAVVTTLLWLQKNKKSADFKSIISFIGDCAKAVMAESSDKNLHSHVQNKLDTKGFN